MPANQPKNDSTSIATLFVVMTVVGIAIALTRWTGVIWLPFSLPIVGAVVVGTLYSLWGLEPGVETGVIVGSILGALCGCLAYGAAGLVLFPLAVVLGWWAARRLLPFETLQKNGAAKSDQHGQLDGNDT